MSPSANGQGPGSDAPGAGTLQRDLFGEDGGMETERPDLNRHDTDISTRGADEPDEPDDSDPAFETVDDPRIPEGKMFFKIGEVAKIVGVKPYVLRYWETEFSWLRPSKTSSGQRLYRRQDVALLLTIQRLRYRERHTIAASRQMIRELRGERKGKRRSKDAKAPVAAAAAAPARSSADNRELMAMLGEMRRSVRQLMDVLED